jgi:hypothetical protein
MEEITYLNYE